GEDLLDGDILELGLAAVIAAEPKPDERIGGKGRLYRGQELLDAFRAQCRSFVVRKRMLGKSCLARSAHQAFCARKTGAPVRSSAILTFWAAMKRSSSLGSSLSIQRATS